MDSRGIGNRMNLNAVIMAGGKGSRISSLRSDIPKPMIDICGKPLLERQLEWLKAQGITEVTIIVGHLGNIIYNYFQDGKQFGIKVRYVTEDDPLGTAGGLFYIRSRNDDPILLINGDIMLDIDLRKLLEYHDRKKADITLLTHPNDHPFDSALIVTDHNGRVIEWINKEDFRNDNKNRVNAGIHVIESHTLDFMLDFKDPRRLDLDREFLKPNIKRYKIFSYDTPEYVKDMGTPERYQTVCKDFQEGLIARKNLNQKQKAIFLDRDGTVNKHKGFITDYEQIELTEGSAEAIREINKSGWLAILITNQPVIARGDCTVEELERIHNRLERLLGESGAYLDDIFYCPHHPDKGFEGERPELKIDCTCRKPKPGLLYEAARKYNIDLAESFMIGDSETDIEAGRNAGCRTGFIRNENNSKAINANLFGKNLKEIVRHIFDDHNQNSF